MHGFLIWRVLSMQVLAATFLSFALIGSHGSPGALRADSWQEWRTFDLGVFLAHQSDDNTLAAVRRNDISARDADGKLVRLTAAEHLRRASVYMANRAFDEARKHWQALISYYPQDTNVSAALLGIGRSYLQERRYQEAFSGLDQLARNYPQTREGSEGLNFSATSLLRMGRPSEAVEKYRQYIERYPAGERIESAHLNIIDSLREAGRTEEAVDWIARTRERFAGTQTATNALFARLRLDIAEGDWRHAVSAANDLISRRFERGVLTTPAEVSYLKAFSLEQAGQREAAVNAYLSIPDGVDFYYGWLATEHLRRIADSDKRSLVEQRMNQARSELAAASDSYPAPYRQTILTVARTRELDPRFILAIIRQESVFRPLAKSPSGARGLLQLTIDAAQKYAKSAGLNVLRENELYRPETSILVGSEYLAELSRMFPNLLEAVAASYNGGEDNVARWVRRSKQKDAGVFTSEVGFEETKGYVAKVMANYRAYQQLYTANLTRR